MRTQISIIRSFLKVMALTVIFVASSMQAAAQTEKSLYERLGGVFAISAVVDHFSLKFMRTLWVCEITGGPYKYTPTKPGSTPFGLENAHRDLKISPPEFDEVAAELGRTLDWAKVSTGEKGEVLAAFAAHKGEVTAGYKAK